MALAKNEQIKQLKSPFSKELGSINLNSYVLIYFQKNICHYFTKET